MKLAIKQVDITPEKPCWQGGYVQRKSYFEKVHDPIMATIFTLTIQEKKLVWVTMDVSGVQEKLAKRIQNKVKELEIDLDDSSLVIAGTHTHSGPLVGSYNDREVDSSYIEFLVDIVSNAIVETVNIDGTEVHVKYNQTLIDGLYSNRNDKNKKSDKLITMLGFFNESEQLIGIYYTMAHHCTVLGPNFMECSADLFGELRKQLQEEYGIPVFMAQGNAGDMGNKQYRNSNLFDEVKMQAENLIDQIHKKHTPWIPLTIEQCSFNQNTYHATYDIDALIFEEKKKEFEEKLKTETNFDTIKLLVTAISSFERKIKKGSCHVEREMPYRILKLDDLEIVMIPGELGSILGMRIKEASKAKLCIVWGYVNPCDLGYMIEKEAYQGFSQESNVTDYPAGVPDEYVKKIIEDI